MDLDWPDCRNVRDVGGLTTSTGRLVRPGALIRADRLTSLTPAGLDAMSALDVTRILDLRSAEECEKDPGPFADDPRYVHQPVLDPTVDLDWKLTRTEAYLTILDLHPQLFAAAVAALADAPPGAVVVHCHAGKDRTGVVVALALSLVGVPAAAIAEDYGRSADGLSPAYETLLTDVTDPERRELLGELLSSRPETMTTVLAELTARHGGALPYLTSGGLTPSQVRALHDRLLS